MTTNPELLLKALAAPFPPETVDWRLGTMKADKTKGMALAYIDARTVQDRLDAVCGAFWACDHIVSGDKRVTCRIGIKVGDEWVFRSDGAGETDVEGEKGSYSDSFKRAAVKWGIGRYLYDLASPWVETEPMGKSYRIKDSEKAKLDRIARGNPSTSASVTATKAEASAQPAPKPTGPIQIVDTELVKAWRHEVKLCQSAADLDRLKKMPEFKTDWKAMSQAERDTVQGIFESATASFARRQAA